MINISNYCINLQHLDISGCKNINNNNNIINIINKQKKLKLLDIQSCNIDITLLRNNNNGSGVISSLKILP